MNIFNKILIRNEFSQQPPVLVDIGASGQINPKWRDIAKYCCCLIFDPDARKMGYVHSQFHKFKKLYVYPALVHIQSLEACDFYLTQSPFCSSLLEPDLENLENWSYQNLFRINEVKKLKTVQLNKILDELNLTYVDWFKTDSQGLDLSLFKSLDSNISQKALVAEFEPGIIDAYVGEDKLYRLLEYMQNRPFWMVDLKLDGSCRIKHSLLREKFNDYEVKLFELTMKRSPGWAEVTYFNTFDNPALTLREYLLGWVFATIEKQYGFALELAHRGFSNFHDPVFQELEKESVRMIKRSFLKTPFLFINKVMRRLKIL